MTRKIIHCDADCFYAAIEMRDNPALKNRPMAVGGRSDRRGVIATCNYLARQYGIHSAMASAQAQKRCPELLIVPPRMDAYKEASATLRAIFHEYTDTLEPLSLDEAYLDVSTCDLHQGSATRIAEDIRHQVQQQLGITVSAGVSNSKFLAKIASDWHKPDGLFVIPPEQVDDFVRQLPVHKLHGVGKVTAKKLHGMNIQTCGDLQRYSLSDLQQRFGRFGQRLHDLAKGIDHREVKSTRIRKSLSVEHTYSHDLPDSAACLQQVPSLFDALVARLKRADAERSGSKPFVKVKFSDFSTTTVERAIAHPHINEYQALIKEAVARKPFAVRLLGLGVRFSPNMLEPTATQLDLFPTSA